MVLFTARELSQACQLFLRLAYPAGPATIPVDVRPYAEIAEHADVADYLPPEPFAVRVCQMLDSEKSGGTGFTFRLGRQGYRHLKMRVQQMEHRDEMLWVFSVDTHDKCLLAMPNQSAAELELMNVLKKTNAEMKSTIEKAFDQAHLLTPTELLRIDLTDE